MFLEKCWWHLRKGGPGLLWTPVRLWLTLLDVKVGHLCLLIFHTDHEWVVLVELSGRSSEEWHDGRTQPESQQSCPYARFCFILLIIIPYIVMSFMALKLLIYYSIKINKNWRSKMICSKERRKKLRLTRVCSSLHTSPRNSPSDMLFSFVNVLGLVCLWNGVSMSFSGQHTSHPYFLFNGSTCLDSALCSLLDISFLNSYHLSAVQWTVSCIAWPWPHVSKDIVKGSKQSPRTCLAPSPQQ